MRCEAQCRALHSCPLAPAYPRGDQAPGPRGYQKNTRELRHGIHSGFLPACAAPCTGQCSLAMVRLNRCAQANSTAFDTMSNASLNTEDGAATYTNSEYTSHLVLASTSSSQFLGFSQFLRVPLSSS